jgi:hypothetical protein
MTRQRRSPRSPRYLQLKQTEFLRLARRGRRCCFNSASAGSGGRFLGSTCRRRAQKATAAGRNRPRDPHDPISTARAPASSAGRWPCDGGAAASRHSTGTRGHFFWIPAQIVSRVAVRSAGRHPSRSAAFCDGRPILLSGFDVLLGDPVHLGQFGCKRRDPLLGCGELGRRAAHLCDEFL